ncbi:MAG TPA: hypothetical protein VNA04_02420 [Thermoanaerobaculia bacterium]|nr:hypothetical protein [Thermoanaerobaculia bacterium]
MRSSLLATVLLLFAAPASAYVYWQCDGEPTLWRIDPIIAVNRVNILVGTPEDEDIREALTRWNVVPASTFGYRIIHDVRPRTSSLDSLNQIEFMGPDEAEYAHAHTRNDVCIHGWPGPNQDIVEGDIHFVANFLLETPLWQFGVPHPREFLNNLLRLAALHEVGHTIGLSVSSHENRFLETMNSLYPAGGQIAGFGPQRIVPLPDSVHALNDLYPESGGFVDPFVSNFRLVPGQMSATLVPGAGPCVTPGSALEIHMTMGNRGNRRTSGNIVGFYMSPSTDLVGPGTIKLGEMTREFGPYQLLENRRFFVTIPPSTPVPQRMLFGLRVDDADAMREAVESNNATTVPGSPLPLQRVDILERCP